VLEKLLFSSWLENRKKEEYGDPEEAVAHIYGGPAYREEYMMSNGGGSGGGPFAS